MTAQGLGSTIENTGSKANLRRSTNMATSWSSWPLKDKTAFANLDHQLGAGWHLKAAYTHRESDTDGKIYYGGGGFPNADRSGMIANVSHMLGTQKMKAYDFNVSGPYSLFGREHELMVGYGEAERSEDSPYMVDGPGRRITKTSATGNTWAKSSSSPTP